MAHNDTRISSFSIDVVGGFASIWVKRLAAYSLEARLGRRSLRELAPGF